MKVKRLSEDAKLPTYGTPFSAGLDLYSIDEIEIPPLSRQIIGTGISVELENEDEHGFIWPRSGLSFKAGLDVLGGVIDNDYRGEIKVIIFNSDKNFSYKVGKGERIAQLVVQKVSRHTLIESEIENNTDRGNCGFGSTGLS